jgi:heme-degrading monooxygenase HmoA
MIARHWRGLAKASQADAYLEHLRLETIPSLSALPGFVNVSVLRRDDPRGIEFLVVTHWESLESIRAFAGENIKQAVIPEIVRGMMVECDEIVRHYEVCQS